MMALTVALCALAAFTSNTPVAFSVLAMTGATMRDGIPMRTPTGWETEQQGGSTILTPGDLAEGRFHVVMVTLTPDGAGSLDEILQDGERMVAETGVFEAAIEPMQSRSDGGWDYKFVLGTLRLGDRAVVAQLMAIKDGDEGGVVVVLSDSQETMGNYADAFAEMVRGMGVAEPARAPAGVVDLLYAVPAGWVEQRAGGFPLLVKEKSEEWIKYRFSLLILPSEALTGSLREQFGGFWTSFVSPNYTTAIAPLPLMARLESGYACAFDADSEATGADGVQVTVAIYTIAHGGRIVPIMGIYSGPDWTFDEAAEVEIGQFLDTARIPDASEKSVPLYADVELSGAWSDSSSEFADYVTAGGEYAGDATISTGVYLELGAEGSYSHTLMALTADRNIREEDEGTWTVDDDELVLSSGGRYSLLGYGSVPDVGRFLVLGNYSDIKSRLLYTNPRGILQAQWLRAE